MDSIIYALHELFNHLAEILIVFVVASMTVIVKHVQQSLKKHSMRKFERKINQNMRVRELLAELRVLYDADRVSLWQFSNGDYYVSGASIMRCSLTHYVTKTGIAAPPTLGQPLTTSTMPDTLKALQQGKPVLFEHDANLDDSFQEGQFTATGMQVVLAVAVKDYRKNWLGIVALSWLEPLTAKQDSKNIASYALQVGEVLLQD